MDKVVWTEEALKVGLERFIVENGHLPTAPEVDRCDYLPSSRQIQRKFGGLEVLRTKLGYKDTHFGRGKYRKNISVKVSKRGMIKEFEIEKILIKHFGELFVHSEKRYGMKGNRADFLVFSPDGNFGVDVFYTETYRDMQKNINLKVDKYLDFPSDTKLIFLNTNTSMPQTEIDRTCEKMVKMKTLQNLSIMGLASFTSFIRPKRRYDNPIGFEPILEKL